MPYPTNDEVKAIVGEMFGNGDHAKPENIENILSDDFEGSVAGRHFSLGHNNLEGKKAWLNGVVHPMNDARDKGKPGGINVVRVIGSGDGWYAVEFLTTGTSKKGKKWYNEGVALTRYTEDKKLVEAKMFMDSQHVQKHLDEAAVAK